MAFAPRPLDEQVIVITGASSGIGLCTALMAAERGARVVLVARSEETLANTVRQIRAQGGEAIYAVADVAKREQLESAAISAINIYGRIDTWVNNAGVAIYGRLDEVSDADHRRLFDVNFWGVVNGSLIALPYLRDAGGVLINVGSEVSDAVIPLQGMYSASKHAVKGFTDALRIEVENLEEAPVLVTLIQPTAVNTPYPQHARNYMDHEPRLPSPMIDPQTVADAILDAATNGGRDVKVGALAKANTSFFKFLPKLGDQMATMQSHRQQLDQAPVRPAGTLYQPGREGRIYGRSH
jgi:short-subunit dehydrogenase